MTSDTKVAQQPPRLRASYIPIGTPPYDTFSLTIERGWGVRVQFMMYDEDHVKQIVDTINNPPGE